MFMIITALKKALGSTIALVLLLSALVGYLPTSSCHCREAKTTKSEKLKCPFGQLRNLSISLTAVPQWDFSQALKLVTVSCLFNYKELEEAAPLLAFDAQAPPSFL